MNNIWDAEIQISPEQAQACIAAQFPELCPLEIAVLGKGFDNTVFLVNQQYAFRFPRRSVSVQLLEQEGKLLPLLAPSLSVPLSLPCFFGKPTRDFGYPFLGSVFVPGHSADTYALRDDERIALAPHIARFLQELHHIENNILFDQLSDDPLDRFNIPKRYAVSLENIQKIEALALSKFSTTIRNILEQIKHISVAPYKKVVVHGDLYSKHILLDGQKKFAGIIDWGDMHKGHRAVDLAIAFTFFPPAGQKLFFDAYGALDQNTYELALLRAINHTLICVLYANDVNDVSFLTEAQKALQFISESSLFSRI